MGIRALTVLTLVTCVVAVTAATALAGRNCDGAPAGETVGKPAEQEAPADAVTEQYDIDALVARLRATKAIGFFTKLALKNEIDDLMDRFRRFHTGEGSAPLEKLRDHYNLLFMKVITLLQDGDPPLGQEIAGAREILWVKLADPREFARQ